MKNAPAKVTEAHKDYQELLKVLQLGRLAGAMLGQQLYRLYANNAYREAIGGEITWHEFLKMPEVNLDPREAKRAMEIYEEFCVKRGYSTEMLAEAGTKTLHYLLPVAKNGEVDDDELKDLMKAGATLPQNSFREKLYEVRAGEAATKTFEYQLMQKRVETGTMQRVPGVDHEMILQVFKNAGIDLEAQTPEII